MTYRAAIIGACFTLLVAGAFAVGQTLDGAPDASVSAPADQPSATRPAVIAPWTAPPATTTPPAAPPIDVVKPAAPEPAPAPVTTAPATDTPAPAVASPTPLPPEKPSIADKADRKDEPVPAKQLFSAEKLPSLGKAMAIGYYPRGCLQGGVALPVNGPTWQVMRLSRNRNWGHPSLVQFLERFAPAAAKATGWKGILVGDMAQPRGGPTPFGHMSHQTGLDVDVWFMPMPGHTLSSDEREKVSAINLVGTDWKSINPKTWTPQHYDFIRVAAQQPGVERVLVNAAIKKEMCRMQGAKHPDWMEKVRPWYAHHDHIHVRLECPADSPNCRPQPSVPDSDGCGAALDYWFSDKVLKPKPRPPGGKPPRPITLADLPPACKTVLAAPAKSPTE
ncbi:penicillin-insensitive murein endopeptidase [Undibacter mobilis]|uniref:Penicillin-insensitive murein endopeptidase n=1 Tax=Undibacter mobilis TaxID=2292256 RepID=A0A371B9X8_9BRAD|nr:penicillin-insensitive murein endopeptidase [Undibacter mobilis]RDV04419.1 penicillin-insensitive murein endopeptidase [Undibacter mobilis]